MRILIAEDDPTSTFLLEKILEKAGYPYHSVADGLAAHQAVREAIDDGRPYDVVLTDWMMPELDGIELIRLIRAECQPSPLLLVITALSCNKAKEHALDSGADGYLAKPYTPQELLHALETGLARRAQSAPPPETLLASSLKPETVVHDAPFTAVAFTGNTGAPLVYRQLFHAMHAAADAAYFLILQAPIWALDIFMMRLEKALAIPVTLAEQGEPIRPGHVYIAPYDRHLQVTADYTIDLSADPPENHARPSSDRLFSSIGRNFGSKGVGVVLTGIGSDGLLGAASMVRHGGHLLCQDPRSAQAPTLPQGLVDMAIAEHIAPPGELARLLDDLLDTMKDRDQPACGIQWLWQKPLA